MTMYSFQRLILSPNDIISSISSSFCKSVIWSISSGFSIYLKYLLFILASLLAMALSLVDLPSTSSGIFPSFFSSIQSINFCSDSISVISYPYSGVFLLSSNNISLLFTRSITSACFLSSPDEIALPILCRYVGLLPVFAVNITPDTPFKCTPSSIIPTQYNSFKCSEVDALKSSNCCWLSECFDDTLYTSGCSSILPNHSPASCCFSCISCISLQKIIYFPSLSVICSSSSSGIPCAWDDCSTNSSYLAFKASFSSPSALSLCCNNVSSSSCSRKSGVIYLGCIIIPSSIASNSDISDATEPWNNLSTTFAPSFLTGVAESPNTFASGYLSNSIWNFLPHSFCSCSCRFFSSFAIVSSSSNTVSLDSLLCLVFKWCISSTTIISGLNFDITSSTLSFSSIPNIVWYSIHFSPGINVFAQSSILPYCACISSALSCIPPINLTTYSYICCFIAFLGDKNSILWSGCSNIYFKVTNDFPHPVGNTTAAYLLFSNSASTSSYASSWWEKRFNFAFSTFAMCFLLFLH